ncbi:MAG: TAXI family TRAP transporter solute-binding subunit [Planctomycetota bacterium]
MLKRHALLLSCALLVACGGGDQPEPKPQPQQPRGKQPGGDLARLKEAKAEPVVLDGRPVVLTGAPGGAYYELARRLRGEDPAKPLALVQTTGSLETLELLAWGAGDAGIVQADVLQDARQRALRQNVQVRGALFLEEVHVLVPRGGAVKSLLDLAGKKVAVGAPGSGSATTAENLLWAGGVYDVTLAPMGTEAAFAALGSGEVAAVIAVGGQPLVSLIGRADVAVLDLAAEREALLAELQKLNPSYAAATVSKEHGGPAETVGIPALLVVRAGADLKLSVQDAGACAHPKGAECASWSGRQVDAETLAGPSIVLRDPAAPLRLAAASEGGCDGAAKQLARALEAGGAKVQAVGGAGSLQALALLEAGQAELGLVSEDVLLEALTRPQTAALLARVRVVAPLFAQSIYLVQKEGGALGDAASLRQQDLKLGPVGSGLWVSARRLLRQKRVLPEHYTAHLDGEAKAWFRLGSPAGGEAAIDLGAAEGYEAGEGGGVKTRVLLLCRRDLDAEQVTALVQTIFAQRKNLAGADERLAGLDPAALESVKEPLKLHPGVAAAREKGIEVDTADPW